MKLKISISIITAILFLSGCSTSIISSGKTNQFKNPASSLNIVFLQKKFTFKHVNLFSTSDAENANTDQNDLALKITKIMPKVFSENGIPSSAKISKSNKLRNIRSLFPSSKKSSFLVLKVIDASKTCGGGCFRFKIQASLINSLTGNVTYQSIVLLPPKATRFSDFSGVVEDFSKSLHELMKKDKIIKN